MVTMEAINFKAALDSKPSSSKLNFPTIDSLRDSVASPAMKPWVLVEMIMSSGRDGSTPAAIPTVPLKSTFICASYSIYLDYLNSKAFKGFQRLMDDNSHPIQPSQLVSVDVKPKTLWAQPGLKHARLVPLSMTRSWMRTAVLQTNLKTIAGP